MSTMEQLNEVTHGFLTSLSAWASKPYAADLRYIAYDSPDTPGIYELLSAELVFYPLPIAHDLSFSVSSDDLIAGQYIQNNLSPDEVSKMAKAAIEGRSIHRAAVR